MVHPRRRAEVLARVRHVAKLLLDAQQLVVLGEALRTAGRARLDLARAREWGVSKALSEQVSE